MASFIKWVRPNILALKPYTSARDEFHGAAQTFLDANENPFMHVQNIYYSAFFANQKWMKLSLSHQRMACMP